MQPVSSAEFLHFPILLCHTWKKMYCKQQKAGWGLGTRLMFSLSPGHSQILSHFSTFSPWQNLGVACEHPSRVRVRVHNTGLKILEGFVLANQSTNFNSRLLHHLLAHFSTIDGRERTPVIYVQTLQSKTFFGTCFAHDLLTSILCGSIPEERKDQTTLVHVHLPSQMLIDGSLPLI